uniref:Uncharacterized protein n=1 Tax=Arundo donax TaxID=35708 RepID=A0A0A9CF85_ARUDO
MRFTGSVANKKLRNIRQKVHEKDQRKRNPGGISEPH